MKLGIIYKNNKIINHRSLLKILINPLLRYFGYYIGSICENEKIVGIKFLKGQKTNSINYEFKYINDFDFIDRKRILF